MSPDADTLSFTGAARQDVLSTRRLMSACWEFGRVGETPYAPFMRLMPGGRIGGYRHVNETLWELRHGRVVLLGSDGRVTTMFDEVERDADGLMTLRGFYVPQPDIRHVLVEIIPHHAGHRGHLPARLIRRRPATGRRHLVVVRANEASLHPSWEADLATDDRTWDLCTSWYGSETSFPPDDGSDAAVLQNREHKFHALRSLFASCPDLLEAYDYFLFPDDDLQMRWSDINRMFHACRMWGLEIAQPSLHPDGVINYQSTIQDARYRVRYTSMVEIMVPLFSRDALRACLPSFDLTQSAFGIDYTWPRICGTRPEQVGIVDEVAVLHTRPTGKNYDINAAYREGDEVSARYGRAEFFEINIVGGIYR